MALGNPVKAPSHGGQVFSEARLRGVRPDRILDFSANINPLGPSSKALQRLRRDLALIRFYPDTENRELRNLVADTASIDGDCILFGNGATPLLHLIPRVLKPRKAVVLEPGFSEYSAALAQAHCQIHRLLLSPETCFQLHREALFDTLRRARPDLLILGNPNNPTGNIVPRGLLSRLIDTCYQRGIYLVVDESFLDFTPYPSCAVDATKHPRLIVVRSLTKFWALAGLRIGYLVAHKKLVNKLSSGLEPWSVNTLASAAAAESLRDDMYRNRTLDLVRRERAFLATQLARLGWLEPLPSETNFLLVRITAPGITSTHLCERLAERNILLRDGSGFPGLDHRYFRVAVRRRSENRRLVEELRAVSATKARPTRTRRGRRRS
jgi:threonine-phosphate decarboxylase